MLIERHSLEKRGARASCWHRVASIAPRPFLVALSPPGSRNEFVKITDFRGTLAATSVVWRCAPLFVSVAGSGVYLHLCSSLLLHSCPTLCVDPMDCSPPGSSVQGILQARALEWVAMPSSRGSSWPRDRTCVSEVFCIGRFILYH